MIKFIEKIMQFFRSLFSKKTDESIAEKNNSKSIESEEKDLNDSKFKVIVFKVWHLLYKFLKKLHSLVMKIRPLTNSKKYKHNNI